MKRRLKLAAVALAILIGAVLFGWRSKTQSDTAHRLVEAGAALIDVRTAEEFAAGHIPGAINVPVHRLEARLAELPDKDRPIVVYCRSGQRSGRARRMLQDKGYTAIHDLGAMSNW